MEALTAQDLGLEIRPMRPADRERVLEMCADVWGGEDYVPQVFDSWVSDPHSWFHAAELDGFLIALQRMRPLRRGVLWYEGLRVASSHRHRGIAHALVTEALAEATRLGFAEMRCATGEAHWLFEDLGFTRRAVLQDWIGRRIEGGEPAQIPGVEEAPRLLSAIQSDGALTTYGGLTGDLGGANDVDLEEIERLLAAGRVRTLGSRAVALVRASHSGSMLRATFSSGSGALLHDLLLALRYEADADGREGVALLVPEAGHPGLPQIHSAGFEPRLWRGEQVRFYIFSRRL